MGNANSTMKGRFNPKNPSKYVGNVRNIMFRSSWEYQFLKWLDNNPAILSYASEELAIPYVSPLDQRVHRYFPDFIVLYKHKDGSVRKEIVEIKPYKETVLTPKATDRDKQALAVNHAKWAAAQAFAEQMGCTFRVITEKSLFYNPNSGLRQRKAPGLGKAV